MARIIDLYLVYQFIARLITPFDQWDAFRLGIIDKDGKVKKKRATLTSDEEKKAWGHFDILAANVKKLINKLPGGDSKLVSYAAAGLLLKEQAKLESMDEDEIELFIHEELANVVGNGKVAGLGVGSQGEPPGKLKQKTQILRRKLTDVDNKPPA
jgi:hypothetical protein